MTPDPHGDPSRRRPRRRAGARTLAATLVAVTVVAGGVGGAGARPADAAAAVRIMPIGDSITEGGATQPTYRLPLDRHLRAAGVAFDMVGSRRSTHPADFDQDHEGHGGWRADQLLDGRPRDEDQGRLADWVAATPPDIVLLHIGTNDTRQCQPPASTADEIARIIATVRAANADVDVLVARIIPGVADPGRPCAAETAARYAELNDRIGALAAAVTTGRSQVVAVDQASGFDIAADTDDGVHPNARGAAKMADRFLGPLTHLLGSDPPPPSPGGPAYWLAGIEGRVYPFGSAAFAGDLEAVLAGGRDEATDIEARPTGDGYWLLTATGGVGAYGAAPHLGDLAGTPLLPGERTTALAATPSGEGYLVVTTRGRVAAFGDAPALGDLLGLDLVQGIVGATTTRSGSGYWLVAADGGVFAFGDATFQGSAADLPLAAPVVALEHSPDGAGYWLVAADGGIFSYAAPFAGSMGGRPMNAPVVGMSRLGHGYLLVGADGGVFNFSEQPFAGSLGASPPPRPVVALGAAG